MLEWITARLMQVETETKVGVGMDKKTINLYAAGIVGLSLPDGLAYIDVLGRLASLFPKNLKSKSASRIFVP